LVVIQWYPGHMTKTNRTIEATLREVDIIIEVRDARIPWSSANPVVSDWCRGKGHVVILNKHDLADPQRVAHCVNTWPSTSGVMACTATHPRAKSSLIAACQAVIATLPPKKQWRTHGLVVGIPNVGKSQLINQLRGRAITKVANRPGVTRGLQWIHLTDTLHVVDSPGILWPKLDPPELGIKLALAGAIKPEQLDFEALCHWLIDYVTCHYPGTFIPWGATDTDTPESIIQMWGKRRGFLLKGGHIDRERAMKALIHAFQLGQLGRISLDTSPEGS
jgi:ribosome biogenesis GTPase A